MRDRNDGLAAGGRLGRFLPALPLLGFIGLSPRAAQADLTAAFAGAVDVDATYATGTTGATDIAFAADGRAIITTKSGTVHVRAVDGSITVLAGQFATGQDGTAANVDTASEKGLLGVVADPDEANNHSFYFYVSNGANVLDKHRVVKAVLNADDTLSVDLANPIIGASRGTGPGLEGPANHDGGGLFIYKNRLYVGVGDTGHNATPPVNKYASCLNKGNGKILRVNLDGSVPADNPLVGMPMVTACTAFNSAWSTAAPDERIFAWGLRNPWRFWIDPLTDLLWIGDVGEITKEEVDIGAGDQHYGYPFIEGDTDWRPQQTTTLALDCSMMLPSRPCSAPVHAYAHPPSPDDAAAVTGGLIPSGCGWSNAFGGKVYYLFADSSIGWLRALEVTADHTALVSSTPLDFGTFAASPVSFRMGPDQALYVVFYGANAGAGGVVYRFAPHSPTGGDCGSSGSGGAGGGGAGGSGEAGQSGADSGAGGSGGSAGSAAAGASGSVDMPGSASASGCSCRIGSHRQRAFAWMASVLGAALLLTWRRRRER